MTMTLQSSITHLDDSLATLEEAVAALHVTLSEDRPAGDVPALVDRFDNTAAELRGDIAEARAKLRAAPGSDTRATEALRDCHRLLNGLSAIYLRGLASYGAVSDLMDMGDERGRAWQSWCRATLASIESCAEPLAQAHNGLLESWSELAERRAPVSQLRAVAITPGSHENQTTPRNSP
jgi:hypothetical protein